MRRIRKYTAAAHAYVNPRPSFLGAISALGHVVFILFLFKKQKEMKKISK